MRVALSALLLFAPALAVSRVGGQPPPKPPVPPNVVFIVGDD